MLQLSKCPKFETMGGGGGGEGGIRLTKGFVFKQRDITRYMRVLLFREWLTIIISFIKIILIYFS